MPSALARFADELIANQDMVHANLEIMDEMIHALLESTMPKRSLDEDCNCGKQKRQEGKAAYE